MVKEVKLGIAGFGTVGRSLLGILDAKQGLFEKKYNLAFKILALFEYDGMLFDPDGLDIHNILEASNIRDLRSVWHQGKLAKDEIPNLAFDLLVEMTPTNVETAEPAISHMRAALNSGKHVVSSNKGPFLLFFDEVMDLAQKNGKQIRFESTVGSGIPILQVAESGINGNEVTRIEAILNGTSNYILTRMANEKLDFDLALKEAQERGYAEADPTLDIGGHDAAGKLVILANSIMGMKKTIKDVKTEGIVHVNLDAILMARKEGFMIKHLGIADSDGNLEVKPTLVPVNSPLGAAISGTLNAVRLETDLANEIILMGHGAGGNEAAAGILTDIIQIYKN